jgi:hypothetical protein
MAKDPKTTGKSRRREARRQGARAAAPTAWAQGGARQARPLERPARPPYSGAAASSSACACRPRAARAAPGSEDSSAGKYVYCIIRADRSRSALRPIGIGSDPADVHTVTTRTSPPSSRHADRRARPDARERAGARARQRDGHARPHRHPDVVRHGLQDRDDIVELLRSAYDAFRDVLTKMEDKLEFGLKVLWDRDADHPEIEKEDEDIRRLKGEISSQKGRPTSRACSTAADRRGAPAALGALRRTRSSRRCATCRSPRASNKPIGDRMIMNAAFLGQRDRGEAFDARVKEIGARYDKLTFKYTGPWPPYNFVNIRLKLERAH